jgi:hypothetical protein
LSAQPKNKEKGMAHLLAATRHVRTSVHNYWPAAVIALGIAASLTWTAFLLYVAIGLAESLTMRLLG